MSNSRSVVKLDLDERDELKELIGSQGWLISLKVLDQLLERMGRDVLTLQEPDRVLKRKAEYDGAQELLAHIKNLKKILGE